MCSGLKERKLECAVEGLFHSISFHFLPPSARENLLEGLLIFLWELGLSINRFGSPLSRGLLTIIIDRASGLFAVEAVVASFLLFFSLLSNSPDVRDDRQTRNMPSARSECTSTFRWSVKTKTSVI